MSIGESWGCHELGGLCKVRLLSARTNHKSRDEAGQGRHVEGQADVL